MPNIAIVGSRTFTDFPMMQKAWRELMWDHSWSDSRCRIVSGGAEGADKLSEQLGVTLDIPLLIHPAQWSLYGRSAGYRRNELIVNDADVLLAFYGPEGETKGTAHSVSLARARGIPVHIYYQEKE